MQSLRRNSGDEQMKVVLKRCTDYIYTRGVHSTEQSQVDNTLDESRYNISMNIQIHLS